MTIPPLSRRDLLRLAAGAAVLGGCGYDRSAAATSTIDFGGARLVGLMRSSFIAELAVLTRRHSDEWSRRAGAAIELTFDQDLRDDVRTVARQRKGADLAELDGSTPHEHADRLVDLSDIAEEIGERSSGWLEAARASAMVDGVWRAIPWSFGRSLVNYRPSVLEAAGVAVPTTYDELLDTATILREQRLPLAGFSMSRGAPDDSAALAYSILWSFGGQEVDESGSRVALDSAATRAALACWSELCEVSDPRALDFDEAGNNDAFLAGQIAMTQNSPSILWRARADGLGMEDDIGLASLPAGPSGTRHWASVLSLAVFDHSRNIEAARDWIRFLCQVDRATERADASLGSALPPLADFETHPGMSWGGTPQLARPEDAGVELRRPGWPGPTGREAELVVQNGSIVKMFDTVGRGSATIERAVARATHELARVYES